jgi:hypothetical protein
MRTAAFLAVVLTALALIPQAAHVAVMGNKIGLDKDAYLTVQAIYQGWWRLGFLWAGALLADSVLAYMLRGHGAAFWLAAASVALILVVIAVFLVWTQPANSATQSWTVAPGNWQELRVQWEYSHAVNAGLLFLALCCVTLAAIPPLRGVSVR